MKVYVVYIPQDYQSAEIIGVYTKERLAKNAAKNREQEGLTLGSHVVVTPIDLEG